MNIKYRLIFVIKIKDKMEKSMRKECVNKLNAVIGDINISQKVEESIYNFTIEDAKQRGLAFNWPNNQVRRIYLNKIVSIYDNLNTNKGSVHDNDLLTRLLNGSIDATNIANLTPQQIHPNNWGKLLERKYANDEFIYSNNVGIVTNQYTCSRCKKNSCEMFQIQTRSADEPMTDFITCLNCGKRWKQ